MQICVVSANSSAVGHLKALLSNKGEWNSLYATNSNTNSNSNNNNNDSNRSGGTSSCCFNALTMGMHMKVASTPTHTHAYTHTQPHTLTFIYTHLNAFNCQQLTSNIALHTIRSLLPVIKKWTILMRCGREMWCATLSVFYLKLHLVALRLNIDGVCCS